jgi:hypothetical protein
MVNPAAALIKAGGIKNTLIYFFALSIKIVVSYHLITGFSMVFVKS